MRRPPCYCDYMGGMCSYCIDELRDQDEQCELKRLREDEQRESERLRNRDLREVYPCRS